MFTHLSSNTVVVQSHPGVYISVGLSRVQEVFRELLPELHIRTATPPLPLLHGSTPFGNPMVLQDTPSLLHYTVHHALASVDGFQLQSVQFLAEDFFVSAPFLVTATRLQFPHGAGI